MKYAINGLLSLTPDGFPLLGETTEVAQPLVGGRGVDQGGPGRRAHDRGVDDARRAGDRPAPLRHHPLLPRTRATTTTSAPAAPSTTTRRTASCTRASSGRRSATSAARRTTRAPQALGAVYFQAGGWERPHWYESNAALVEHYGDRRPPARVGRALVVADHERRAPRAARARRHDRPRAVRDLRHQRTGRARLPAAPHGQQLRRRGRAFGVHAAARRPAAASVPTSRSCASPTTRSASSPARSTAHATSTGSARTSPTTARSRSSTTPSAFATIGVWGPKARALVESITSERHLRRRASLRHRRPRC